MTEKQGQIYLRQRFVVLVFAIACLFETFGVTGNRCAVVGQVLFFGPTFALKIKKPLPGIFGNRGKQFTDSL